MANPKSISERIRRRQARPATNAKPQAAGRCSESEVGSPSLDIEEELRQINDVLQVQGPAEQHLDGQTGHELDQGDQQEEAQEELDVDFKGDTLDIGFNVSYLLDVLNNLDVAEIDCSLGDASSSALFTVPERSDFKYVVMPMRI